MEEGSAVEIDFFQLEKRDGPPPNPPPPDRAGSSRRRIQEVVSRINPALLRTVMAAGATAPARCPESADLCCTSKQPSRSSTPSSTPAALDTTALASLPPLPVLNPATTASGYRLAAQAISPLFPSFKKVPGLLKIPLSHSSAVHGGRRTATLTIFYNGTVSTFDVTGDKADAIIKMAEGGIGGNPVERFEDPRPDDGHQAEGDLPIMRKKSLERFLEKRKKRCVAPAEQCCPSSSAAAAATPEHA